MGFPSAAVFPERLPQRLRWAREPGVRSRDMEGFGRRAFHRIEYAGHRTDRKISNHS
jgi:hypothetical protein